MKIRIDGQWCKGCGLCIWECPKKVLKISKNRNAKGYAVPEAVNEQACIGCIRCERICPENCIEVLKQEQEG